MNRTSLPLVTLIVLAGCTSTYRHSEFQPPAAKLDSSRGVLISVPEDAWYETTQYRNSGRMTAQAVRAAFAKNARKVDITDSCEADDCLDSIDAEKYGYFVSPAILHWEDRATEWSGKRDRVEVQLVVFDSTTKKEVANSSFVGKSKFATFGGDHPQDLLPDPTNEYVGKLYRDTH